MHPPKRTWHTGQRPGAQATDQHLITHSRQASEPASRHVPHMHGAMPACKRDMCSAATESVLLCGGGCPWGEFPYFLTQEGHMWVKPCFEIISEPETSRMGNGTILTRRVHFCATSGAVVQLCRYRFQISQILFHRSRRCDRFPQISATHVHSMLWIQPLCMHPR